MQVTATVRNVRTVKKHLPGESEIDIVQLSYNNIIYYVESEVGIYQVGNTVEATATGDITMPRHLRLR